MRFIHLSDIHFRDSEVYREDDPNAGLRDDLIHDVKYMRHKIGYRANGILISGDIAFGGNAKEYNFALKWLEEELCPASGCDINDVFVIPGNHDVDRSSANSPMHSDARTTLRQYPQSDVNKKIREYMSHKTSARLLFDPIENYNRFAARFLCALGAYDDDKPDTKPFATRSCKLNDGSTLRIWGFNSVLVSDDTDSENRMLVDPAGAQIRREDGVTHLVMCHHPYSWLRNKADFRERIEAVAQIHLFGHEHTRRVEEGVHFTTIRAGAVHPDRDEREWKPGYNWIELNVDGVGADRYLNISVWVRQREGAQFIAVPDRYQNDPWTVRHKLQSWLRPADDNPRELLPINNVNVNAQHGGTAMSDGPTLRSVAFKMFRLNEHEQRQIIVLLGLDENGDQDLKDYEFALAAVRRSAERGQLEMLDHKIDDLLGWQES
ncbi:metallophosphoesterase [Microvirga puerhi]|uniref:Metallophosphoesterase n=1 Tax=Microvirga puerhi TaxID=2876078 RepID=A0ABS7VQS9_9HYPH|nr:metallophosphoesterase [Microvirga puerhi]MBZ6077574.1 metallophosphoesterase [Microvirga puerhi]